MTKTDLRLLYRQETGKDAPNVEDWKKTYIPSKLQDPLLEYVKWLEERTIKGVSFKMDGKILVSVLDKETNRTK